MDEIDTARALVARDEVFDGTQALRIALRRLRSGLTLFSPMLPGEHNKALLEDARWLTIEVTRLRDLYLLWQDTLTPARAALGLARSFQITSIFPDLTTLDNVALAVQAHAGHSFRFWQPARQDAELRQPALEILTEIGLSQRAEEPAANLSHGEQRQLEIAMALATAPSLLLLDEPMAGMGREESARMVQLLRDLKGQHTIVLIEHDMDAVFALADRITVLLYGRAIATDTPEAIRASDEVRAAYLGTEHA